jgi:prepilin-type N-terminal cleavage/methylation domain-containing protein
MKNRQHNGFTIIELIVVVTVIGLLNAIAVGAYNKVVNDARVAKQVATVNALSTAKTLFVSDSRTGTSMIRDYNSSPSYAPLAPYIRVNGAQPADEAHLLSLSAMPPATTITYGTVDDSSFGGTHVDEAPTVNFP